MNNDLIQRYEEGAGELTSAVAGLTRNEFLALPIPGTWSIQQIVIHVLDADLVVTDRMKRTIAEENPTLMSFDESAWVKNLHYDEWSADDAVTIFELNRRNFAKLLRKLPEAAFERVGTHSEKGPMTLRQMIEMITSHARHHLKFVKDKRTILDKQRTQR
jgi:uncharacterized damage-inducible protein DinB